MFKTVKNGAKTRVRDDLVSQELTFKETFVSQVPHACQKLILL